MPLVQGFRIDYPNIVRILLTEVKVCPAHDPASGKPHPEWKLYQALWDTGATGSVITQRVVDEVGLAPVGVGKVQGVGGETLTERFMVNFGLPNNVAVSNLQVITGKIAGAEVLIGMDIIGMGDLTISTFGGKTTFCFQSPSFGSIDLHQFNTMHPRSQNLPVRVPKTPGPNDFCPCGSGKKYKKCHGAPK